MNLRPSITAVIPVHNRADLLVKLLESVAAQTLPFTEIVVVDNASTDGADTLAAARGYTVIRMGRNLGFARAVNAGWRASGSEWIAILNSDVTLDAQWLERLIAAAADFSFATGTILDSGDQRSIDGTYDLMSRAGCAWRAGHGEKPAETRPAAASAPISLAPGTACLFRRDVLERLRGFDEEFESYLEDVDLGLRCVREGYTGVYVADALAWHKGSATLGRWHPRVVRFISRNQLLLISRHYDRELFRAWLWPIIAGQLLWGLVALRHGAIFAWLAGKFDALKSFQLTATPSSRLRTFVEASESEIRNRANGAYWRWYFRLTPSLERGVPRDIPGAAH